jgi:glutathione synthase
MTRELLFIIDPLAGLKPAKDSTLAMMHAAQQAGHRVHICEISHLALADGTVRATVQVAEPDPAQSSGWRTGGAQSRSLDDFDAVLMRKDPPVDTDFLMATQLLSLAESRGARIFNRPAALRDWNEKLGIFRFADFITATCVSSRKSEIDRFLREQGDIIVKPLNAMGGEGIFRLTEADPNRNAVIETLTAHGRHAIMAQRYLPAIREGDKRILLVDGEPLPYALARIPIAGETRGNLAAGGRGVAQALSARDREIAMTVGREVRQHGLFLVGLDVIGEHLTEVNVTSPTGFREITAQTGYDVAAHFITALERACPASA